MDYVLAAKEWSDAHARANVAEHKLFHSLILGTPLHDADRANARRLRAEASRKLRVLLVQAQPSEAGVAVDARSARAATRPTGSIPAGQSDFDVHAKQCDGEHSW